MMSVNLQICCLKSFVTEPNRFNTCHFRNEMKIEELKWLVGSLLRTMTRSYIVPSNDLTSNCEARLVPDVFSFLQLQIGSLGLSLGLSHNPSLRDKPEMSVLRRFVLYGGLVLIIALIVSYCLQVRRLYHPKFRRNAAPKIYKFLQLFFVCYFLFHLFLLSNCPCLLSQFARWPFKIVLGVKVLNLISLTRNKEEPKLCFVFYDSAIDISPR